MRRVVLPAAALLLAVPGCAPAPPPPPVCARPAVLERVADILRARGRTVTLEASPIGEDSTGPGPLINCAARGHTIGYDTNRYGDRPIYEPFIIRYSIEPRQNGLFISVP